MWRVKIFKPALSPEEIIYEGLVINELHFTNGHSLHCSMNEVSWKDFFSMIM